jgi:hypothetical protein
MRELIGGMLIIFGIIMMAGSAGDCDGKCMEYANPIGTMLMVAFGGLITAGVGGLIIISGKNS